MKEQTLLRRNVRLYSELEISIVTLRRQGVSGEIFGETTKELKLTISRANGSTSIVLDRSDAIQVKGAIEHFLEME